jgi:hypothetical protein
MTMSEGDARDAERYEDGLAGPATSRIRRHGRSLLKHDPAQAA